MKWNLFLTYLCSYQGLFRLMKLEHQQSEVALISGVNLSTCVGQMKNCAI